VTPKHHRSLHLLGALFRFESNSVQLLRLVERAFAGLPRIGSAPARRACASGCSLHPASRANRQHSHRR